jgi:hypothetical protein
VTLRAVTAEFVLQVALASEAYALYKDVSSKAALPPCCAAEPISDEELLHEPPPSTASSQSEQDALED